ncbi:MAG: hypothetical protein Q9225_000157 [Loekoesia sp. 1 TL-2023]
MEGYEELDDSADDIFGPGNFAWIPSLCLNPVDMQVQVPQTRYLRSDGGHTRYLKGGQPQQANDDLRPPPLRCGEKSLADILKEEPPEGFNAPSTRPTVAKSPSAKSPFTGSAIETPTSETSKKERVTNKTSFASFRKFFSPKQKTSDSHDGIELKQGLKSQRSPFSRKHVPIITPQDLDGRYGSSTTHPQNFNRQPPGASPIDATTSVVTPHQSASTFGSSATALLENEQRGQLNFSSDRKTPAMTPLGSSHNLVSGHPSPARSSPCASKTSASPGKIHGQPPAAMTRPMIPHKVTEEHLSLISFPPVSKEEIARLPKDIEPTLPTSEHTLDARHCSQPPSAQYVSSHSPIEGALINLSLSKSIGSRGVLNCDPNDLYRDTKPSKHLSALRRCHSTASIINSSQTADRSSDYPMPELTLSRKGKVKKYDRNDLIPKTLDVVAHEETYGHEATIAKYASPTTIQAAFREAGRAAPMAAKKPFGLGISTRGFAQSAGEKMNHQSAFTTQSDSPACTPTSPKSENLTPQTPGFSEFYKNLHQTYSKGSGKQRSSNKQVSSGSVISPTLPRIHEDHVSGIELPSQSAPPSDGDILSSGKGDPASVSSGPSRKLFANTQGQNGSEAHEPILHQSKSKESITEVQSDATSSLAKIERYFRDCTPTSIRNARLSIFSIDERLQVLATVRNLTGTEVVWHERNSRLPKHPNHNRVFKSKNLWCIQHHAGCASCGSACCVYMESVEAYHDAKNQHSKSIAKEAGEVIMACVLNQVEESTFLECGECNRFMCPECIGICPITQCKLQVCKECKPKNWEPCGWHNVI